MVGFYDRIVHKSLALTLSHIGVPHANIHVMLASIQKMIYWPHTAYSDVDIMYGGEVIGDCEYAQQGDLHGNAASPVIWTALSLIVFDVYIKGNLAEKLPHQ